MFRPNTEFKSKKTVNCLITGGGVGDLLCAIPAMDYIVKNCPWINLLVWVPDYMVELTKLCLPQDTVVRGISEAKKKFDESKLGITTRWQGQHTPMRTHPTRYSFHVLCDYSPKIEEMNYPKPDLTRVDLTRFNLPERYMVLQGAYVEKIKTMPSETFNDIKAWLISKGYNIVILGRTENRQGVGPDLKATVGDYNFEGVINLIDKTSMVESIAIMNQACAVVAMDGGLVHMAGFCDVPIVAGYTFVKPEIIMPVRNNEVGWNVYPVEPDESLGCRGCQSNWTLMFKHDFRECYYKDYTCVKHMTSKKFIDRLEEIL